MRSKIYILAVLTLFLLVFNYSVFNKEQQLKNGVEILLPLAPVDPRALLMGDYVTLAYALNNDIHMALYQSKAWIVDNNDEGLAVIRIAPETEKLPGKAEFARLDNSTPLQRDERKIRFKIRGGSVVTASTAFYFQEGRGAIYERAVYARLRLGDDGKTLLVALTDAEGRDIIATDSPRS